MTRKGVFASAVVVLPVLLLSLLGLRSFPSYGASDRVRSQTDLERALEEVRPFEGRWTGLGYTSLREGGIKKLIGSPSFNKLVALTLRRTKPTPDSIRDRALIALILGDRGEAARLLETGIEAYPRDVFLYNDLAVVHLAKARIERDPYQLILALSAIRRAVSLDGGMNEVAFNHALILEQLHLRQQSRQAWRRYLDLDRGSEWAGEARAHLYVLDAPDIDPIIAVSAAVRAGNLRHAEDLVRCSAQEIRFHVEDKLLPNWARAVERRDFRSAKGLLHTAETFASLLLNISGDSLLMDAIDVVRKGQGRTLLELSTAHRLYGEGSALYAQGHYREAEERFVAAKRYFDLTGSPFTLWAAFNADVCEYQQGNVDFAIAAASELRTLAVASGYYNLAGRIDWLIGLVRLERADPTAAFVLLRRALKLFERTQEEAYQGAVASMIASALTYLGDLDEAWKYHFMALSTTAKSDDEARLSVTYGALARSLLKKGEARAALAFQNEALTLEGIQSNPVRASEAFWWRSMIFHDLGKPMLALCDLEHARKLCSSIPEPSTRDRNMAGLLVTEGTIRVSIDPQSAVNVLTKALDLYEGSKYSYLLVDIYLERARALRRLSLAEAAEEDLLAAINEYERQRTRVEGSRQRISYFSRAGDAFDEMVDFQIEDRRDLRKAFDFSERGRARETLDSTRCSRISPCTERPLGFGDVLAGIPARTTLVQYHVLNDRFMIWSLRGGNIYFHQVKIGQRVLEALVKDLLAAVQDRKSDQRYLNLSRKLYQLLVQPVEQEIVASDRLVIVPGGILEELPFAGLLNPRNGRFLIEQLPIAIEPSSTLYISAVQSMKTRQRVSFTSLAVGNPAFDRSLHPDLVSLPAAEREANALARRNTKSMVLTRGEATIAKFIQEINRHDLVHFGGHALMDESAPGGSRLLFAVSQDRSGDLFGAEIERLHLARPRLVVLSACSTGRGSYQGLEGVSDLARPFLVAGVPTVLISLWQVEDRRSEVFWRIFYDQLFTGIDAGSALREAQLAIIHNGTTSLHTPDGWAGYRMVGAF